MELKPTKNKLLNINEYNDMGYITFNQAIEKYKSLKLSQSGIQYYINKKKVKTIKRRIYRADGHPALMVLINEKQLEKALGV